jgi:hypothetical protein
MAIFYFRQCYCTRPVAKQKGKVPACTGSLPKSRLDPESASSLAAAAKCPDPKQPHRGQRKGRRLRNRTQHDIVNAHLIHAAGVGKAVDKVDEAMSWPGRL